MTLNEEPVGLFVYRATLVRVVDADTIRADVDLGFRVVMRNQSLRLAGIDAPEVRGPDATKGRESKRALISFLGDDEMVVKTQKDKSGKYGRWLADVYVRDMHVNKWLVDNGYAVLTI